MQLGTTTSYGGRLSIVPSSTPTTAAGANALQIGEASSNTGYRLQLGYFNDPTNGYVGSLQSYGGGSPNSLVLQGVGGSVLIATTSSTTGIDTNNTKLFVVAPNSVLVNWQREVTKHTELSSYLAHGADRENVIKQWVRHGGVAITSYSTLPKLLPYLTAIDFLAVDEAHYAKNPEAKRTMAIEQIAKHATYVSLMTGTALENKVEELHNLLNIASPGAVRELRPMLQANRAFDRAGIAKKIAHVYLRRTQADVLTELPERIEVDEWVTLTEEDRENYDSQPTNIMLKRRSATVTQAKFERLEDLVNEHRQADRKVVVYSFFRQVLDEVSEMFGNCAQ
ncbi:MAG: hypothetical protein EBW68_11665, partial [Actinobacteria bacterium]|nr:hypothetical protein [Actinomycetota bacterium]